MKCIFLTSQFGQLGQLFVLPPVCQIQDPGSCRFGLNEWISVRGRMMIIDWCLDHREGGDTGQWPGTRWGHRGWHQIQGRYKLADWTLGHIGGAWGGHGNIRGEWCIAPDSDQAPIILNIYWGDYAPWSARTEGINVSNLRGREKIRMKDL